MWYFDLFHQMFIEIWDTLNYTNTQLHYKKKEKLLKHSQDPSIIFISLIVWLNHTYGTDKTERNRHF